VRDEPACTVAEMMAGRWFLRRAIALRFVGIAEHELLSLRNRAAEICSMHIALRNDSDPAATEERILDLLDQAADGAYPRSQAEARAKSTA